jgi:prepilin-type N-terminal cleavage/methylation domain-containing protein
MIGRAPLRRGFTLVELLLTTSLVAVIVIEAGMILRTASRAYGRLQDQAAAAATAEDALWLIGRDTVHVACPTDPARPPVVAADTGSDNAVLLRLRMTGSAVSGRRAQVVDYFVYSEDADRRLLVRRSEPIRHGPADAESHQVAWEILADDVAGFDVRFFDGRTWTDGWIRAADAALPTLIEATLTIRTADGRQVTRSAVCPISVQTPPGPGSEARQ